MAVSSMQAVNVIGLMDNIEEVITVLGESGVFHPDEVQNFYDNIRDFTHLQTKNIYAKPLTNLKAAINLAKQKVNLVDPRDYSPSFEELDASAKVITKNIDSLIEEKNTVAEKLRLSTEQLSMANHFKGMDVEIEKVLNLNFLKARFGRLPKDSLEKLKDYDLNKFIEFAVCNEEKNAVWGVYFAPNERAEEIDKIFDGLYFERCESGFTDETPATQIKRLEKEIPELKTQLSASDKKLSAYFKTNGQRISLTLSKLEELYLYAGIRANAMQYSRSFIIVGWVPSEYQKELGIRLGKIKSVEVDFSDAKNELDKNPPVKLKNNLLTRPFEFYTEMYGMPKYTEIDPTFFVAITYTLLFGIMFADVGQGLILAIVGLLMWKIKKMKIGKILVPCGLCSSVFGLVFGSVFGFEHLLDFMYYKMGFMEKPIEVMERTNELIIFAIGIGIVLLLIAMMLNVYTSFRQKNPGRALFSTSGIAGIIFYGAIVFGLVGELFLGLHVLTLPYILGLIVFPFVLVFFSEPLSDLVNGEKDWQPESWPGFIIEKLFESIEVLLSYVTNTMSFLRVGAFVLVHAGMMLVVFVLAEMVGGIGYWIIVVIGNAIVMALEALLVSIQTLRLEYYEMFSRFYSGEGRGYAPIKLIKD